ncbi:hypothetical protein [Gymnodinialimonas hymeniacidonis]|uniref:hypothetical protein n=1 Tax=Gymnodinialimonas hymeniacidonis TaxID=3126508 RepID=UPI0034C67902
MGLLLRRGASAAPGFGLGAARMARPGEYLVALWGRFGSRDLRFAKTLSPVTLFLRKA